MAGVPIPGTHPDPRARPGVAGAGGAGQGRGGRGGHRQVRAPGEPPGAPRGAVPAPAAGGSTGRRRRLQEHESAAAATAATAVEGARWPGSSPGDPALLTEAAAALGGRGSRRLRLQPRLRGRPPPPGPSSPRPPPASLRPPPRPLAGPARHGAASPPMALRRSMGRSGLPPLPLLAGLAALLLPEPVAEGRGWPGRRRGARAAGGAARVGARAWAGQGFGWGDPAGRPRLGGWRAGRSGVFAVGSRGSHPQLSLVRGSSGGVERKGVGLCG